MRSSEEPPNAQCNQRGGIGLFFDELTYNIAYGTNQFRGIFLNLPIRVLGRSTNFVCHSLGLHFSVVSYAADALLHPTGDFSHRPFHAIFVHSIPLPSPLTLANRCVNYV